jgi:hypothetical protein
MHQQHVFIFAIDEAFADFLNVGLQREDLHGTMLHASCVCGKLAYTLHVYSHYYLNRMITVFLRCMSRVNAGICRKNDNRTAEANEKTAHMQKQKSGPQDNYAR